MSRKLQDSFRLAFLENSDPHHYAYKQQHQRIADVSQQQVTTPATAKQEHGFSCAPSAIP